MTARYLFMIVLNMSITAGWMIPIVLVFRRLLRGCPRVFSYALWGAVYLRLLCPISFSSGVSFFTLFGLDKGREVPVQLVVEYSGEVTASAIDWATTGALHSRDLLTPIAAIWMMGAAAMLFYALYSLMKLRATVKSALPIGGNLYLCNTVDVPFVLGIFKPAIYLPSSITPEEYQYILLHEQTHLRRKDYLVKPIAYMALCIHWFNPLVWLSFWLMTRDMEMSCDELVLRKMGTGIKKNYSKSLLIMAEADKHTCSLYSIAFGETDTKRRIKNVLDYKHPAAKKVALAVCLVAAVSLAVMANPKQAYAEVEPAPPITKPTPAPSSLSSLNEPTSQQDSGWTVSLTDTPPETDPQLTPASGVEEPVRSIPTPTPDVAVGETAKSNDEPALEEEQPAISLGWPTTEGYVSVGLYGYSGHKGIDIAAPSGTEIYAAGSGTVTYASNKIVWPYGKRVVIDHGDGYQTMYAHCSEVLIEQDTEVAQGTLIAKIGRTGNATGNHLHMELQLNGEQLNPEDYIVAKSE